MILLGQPGALGSDPDTSIYFDGVSGQLQLPANLAPAVAGDISFGYWIMPAAGYPATGLTNSAWTYVMGTYKLSTGTSKLYINGVLNTSAASSVTLGTATSLFNGWIDELEIFASELSAARVAAHYMAALSRHGQNGAITELIANGIDQKAVTYSIGFDDLTEANYVQIPAGVVDGITLTGDLVGYRIISRDPATLTNKQVFNVASSSLTAAAASGDTSIYLRDDTGYQSTGYCVIDSEKIQYTGKSTNHGIAPTSSGTGPKAAYGGGVYVMAPLTLTGVNDVNYSTDGKNWFVASTGVPMASLSCCFYGNGKFVCINNNGATGAYSTDGGKTWTALTFPTVKNWACGCYCSGITKFVVLSQTDFVMTSTDGITWSVAAAMGTAFGSWKQVIWDTSLNLLVAVSNNNVSGATNVTTSPDASVFTLRTTPSAGDYQYIITNNAGKLFIGGPNFWASSTNATAWTARTNINTNAGAYDSVIGLFITAGILNHVSTSPDAVTWTTQTGPTLGGNWGAVLTSGAGVAVILGGTTPANFQGYSTNGTAWNTYNSQLTGLTRGMFSTTAAAHASGATVTEMIYYNAHLIDIATGVLQNTDKSGLGITTIDSATFATIKAALGTMTMTVYITSVENAKSWLETQLYQVGGLVPIMKNGLYSLYQMTVPSVSVASITADDIMGDQNGKPMIGWDKNFRPSIINYVQFLYDWDGSNYLTSSIPVQDATSVANFGACTLIIRSKGLRSANAGTDAFIAAVGAIFVGRYKNGAPQVTARVTLAKGVIEAGDILAVTSAELPNRTTKTRGVTGALMEVIARSLAHDQSYTDLTLLWPGW